MSLCNYPVKMAIGPDYIKQRFQEGMDVKETPEEEAKEKPPTPKESPHFYRKGTTPPGTPEESPKHSPLPSAEPSPAKLGKKQNSIAEVRLVQEKKNLTSETVIPVVNKPLYSKTPMKEEMTAKPQPKLSPHNNPSSKGNGELHSHYHGYYVKMNPTLYPYELGEDEDHTNPASSELAPVASVQKSSPALTGAGIQLDAKELLKISESAAPKNPTNNNFYSVEREVNSVGTVH
ncbi:hypothetical protein JD844_016078 [Phrynosoma platyrhinos]|uniref:Uncharacterized protein n=1 Tax=Phrynosoma platyrhinos TaxID=52577 RepID=A0ABQ7SK23_PHRPL|nr:hypothetical protein JD844_016078 [Phrynosoma platyrhinos]